jgi:hypothetical protein
MSGFLAVILLLSPASDAGDFDASYLCKVFAKDGMAREIPGKFGLKSNQLREIEFSDKSEVIKRKYDHKQVVAQQVSVVVGLPVSDGKSWRGQHSRVYNFDFTEMRFGEGSLRISQIVEPRPNVVAGHTLEATGICDIVIPKAAS